MSHTGVNIVSERHIYTAFVYIKKINVIIVVCKTVDRTPPAINMVNYYSLYCLFLSHAGLIFVKLFQSPEKCRHRCVRAAGWTRGMMGLALLRIFSGI